MRNDLLFLSKKLGKVFGLGEEGFELEEDRVVFGVQSLNDENHALELELVLVGEKGSYSAVVIFVRFLFESKNTVVLGDVLTLHAYEALNTIGLQLKYGTPFPYQDDRGIIPMLKRTELLDSRVSFEKQNFDRVTSAAVLMVREASDMFTAVLAASGYTVNIPKPN